MVTGATFLAVFLGFLGLMAPVVSTTHDNTSMSLKAVT
jgi:hypothetical protein